MQDTTIQLVLNLHLFYLSNKEKYTYQCDFSINNNLFSYKFRNFAIVLF